MTHLDLALTLWELMTVVGAVTMLIVTIAIGEANDIKPVYRRLMTISLFLGIKNKALKILPLICGILCFIGFTGSFFFDYLWYPAIMGYGLGFLIMCIYLCARKKSTE